MQSSLVNEKGANSEISGNSPGSQTQDEILLNAVTSAAVTQALELLKEGHTFSKNCLDNALISSCRTGHKFLVQALVRHGADVHTKDTNGNTPLMICAENGFTDIGQFLISKNADINAANSAGDTTLILLIRPAGSTEFMKLLLQHKEINISHQNKEGYTALMKALEAMDIDSVKLLLEADSGTKSRKSSLFSQDESKLDELDLLINNRGETAQQVAERSGLESILKLFRKHQKTQTSLLVLATKMCDINIFSLLLNSKFLNTSDRERSLSNALGNIFHECQLRDVKAFSDNEVIMIRRLLEYGADVSRRWYNTPDYLSVAVESGNYTLVKLLCKRGAVFKDHTLNTAAKNGRADLIKLLLRYNLKIARRDFPNSALDHALIHGHIDCAKLLLQHGSKMDVRSALRSAVEHEQPKYMNFLSENYKHEISNTLLPTRFMNSLLVSAARQGILEIIGQILDLGTDINRPGDDGMIPLAASRSVEVVQYLIQKGADVNQVTSSEYGRVTPLLYILSSGIIGSSSKQEIVQVLLDKGASVKERDCHGRTALMLAAGREGSESMLQILLDHGAELTDRDKKGNTVLVHAVLEDCTEAALYLLQFIGDNKSFLDLQNNKGETALICSVKTPNIVVVQKMISMGVDVNIKDEDGNTALHALMNDFDILQDKEILQTLIEARSDVNWQNNDGLSPLMLAARDCVKEAIPILLDSGADVNAVSQKNNTKTALSILFSASYSIGRDRKWCIEYLLDRGASSSFIPPASLLKVIDDGHVDIIPKLIQNGLGPAVTMILRRGFCDVASFVSPVCKALLVGNVALARYFVGNLYLITSDLSSLMSKGSLHHLLKSKNHQECVSFLDEMSSQPMSLFSLAFVSVTSCLAPGPGREDRVNLLPLPQKIKDKLLFKTEEVNLNIAAASNVTAENASVFGISHVNVSFNHNYTFHLTGYYDSDDDHDYDIDDHDSDYDFDDYLNSGYRMYSNRYDYEDYGMHYYDSD